VKRIAQFCVLTFACLLKSNGNLFMMEVKGISFIVFKQKHFRIDFRSAKL